MSKNKNSRYTAVKKHSWADVYSEKISEENRRNLTWYVGYYANFAETRYSFILRGGQYI